MELIGHFWGRSNRKESEEKKERQMKIGELIDSLQGDGVKLLKPKDEMIEDVMREKDTGHFELVLSREGQDGLRLTDHIDLTTRKRCMMLTARNLYQDAALTNIPMPNRDHLKMIYEKYNWKMVSFEK